MKTTWSGAEGDGTDLSDFDPLPQRRLTAREGVGGRIKERPEDFQVDEATAYGPTGEGEHLYLRVRSTNLSHGEVVAAMARHFGVRPRSIGFAGMKDRLAVTTQAFTVHTTGDYSPGTTIHDRIEILEFGRHRNKMRRGHLRGNRFRIRVRGIAPEHCHRVQQSLDELTRIGVPNYFGEQRFGYRRNTHLLGRLILKQDWSGFLDEMLGSAGSNFPDHQRAARERFDAGDYRGAMERWSPRSSAEALALRALARFGPGRRAALAVGRASVGFFISALQSAVFNRIVDQRISSETLHMLEAGDLAWKHDSRSVFRVNDELASDEQTLGRLAAFEISPSGPLWGPGMTEPEGAVLDRELGALTAAGVRRQDLVASVHRFDGVRRPMRVQILHAAAKAGRDEHGEFIELTFELPRGAYATVVLREIL